MGGVRTPAVAGRFYPAAPDACAAAVDDYLARAEVTADGAPRALVAPHAGFVYSGPIAGSAYARLARGRGPLPGRVLILGPAHTVPLSAMAVTGSDTWMTPLGEVPVDDDLRAACLACDGVVEDDGAHVAEHALEVQLPFLQRVLGEFSFVPIVVGSASTDTVADLLASVWEEDVLVVISSDLSHYHDHATARELDRRTADFIIAASYDAIDPYGACGVYPLRGLLKLVAERGLNVEELDLRNSGDTAGDHGSVVGYGAFAVTDPAAAA